MSRKILSQKGFTLAEMMVAVAISALVLVGISVAFKFQGENFVVQEDVAFMQQNARAAMFYMVHELRMIGMDGDGESIPDYTDFGILEAKNDAEGYSTVQFVSDLNKNNVPEDDETITYGKYDFAAGGTDSIPDLYRQVKSGVPQLMAENIDFISFAYAYDSDDDGRPDFYTVGGRDYMYWAIDRDGDGKLDTALDQNLDGLINEDDYAGGSVGRRNIVGLALPAPVPLSSIRAIRIWLVMRSDRTDKDFFDNEIYFAGHQLIQPRYIPAETNGGGFRRMLVDTVVQCRNLGVRGEFNRGS